MSNVRVIPATIEWGSAQYASSVVKRRVAAYARVSTDSDEQLTSYEAQVDYYTRYIRANVGWEFVEIYADEGISATNTKKREGFKRMVRDAINGKIDLIITKSVSRFARNTVDTLTTVRQLKEKGVEIYFEKENIYTLDSKGELLITIMSSLAQEESRSISENVSWGQRKRMQDGKFSLPYGQFLGYEKGEDGLPKIVASEAKVVLLIYTLYLQGKTQNAIARHLTASGIPTPAGKEKWAVSTVMSILQNEKYKGDAILQKRFTVDFLTKKTKANEGELPQYHVEGSHPAIVSPEMFDLVQAEIKKRKAGAGLRQSGLGCFSSKIICGECGGFYGSKVWHSTSKYRRTVWQCNNKFKNGTRCQTPHLNEAALRQAFIEAFNRIYEEKDRLLADYGAIIEALTNATALDAECAELQSEQAIVAELTRKYVEENANTTMNQDDYRQRQDVLIERYGAIKKRLVEIEDEKQARAAKRKNISAFFANIERQDGLLAEFDEELWYNIVESVTVNSESRVDINFKDGTVICVDEQVGAVRVSV